MREELKLEPCPFCGGVDLKTYRNLVECQNLDCGVCGPDMGMLGMSEEGARQVAITAWNTRAKPQGDVGADSGLAAADDNHTQAEVSWRAFLASDKDWLADHGRKMGSGVGQQAVERLLIALDHVAADDNHKALVEALLAADQAITGIELARIRGADDGREGVRLAKLVVNLKAAAQNLAAAFQSRQEEKQP